MKHKMFVKPKLRIATFNVPGYSQVTVMNGKQMLTGLKLYTNVFELFERAGFNVSLVPADERTTGIADKNGTYNGLYGVVQSGKADTSLVPMPVKLSEAIGQFSPIMMDAANLIATKREPVQVFEGTLCNCLTTLGPLNNLLLGVIVALILILLSVLVSKRAAWNFFAQLMTENFVNFRPLSLQLAFMVALFMLRAVFGSAYSTDVAISSPPKLINSLEDLAKSKLLPIWFEGDPVYLEFKQGVTKALADVFNMGSNDRKKTLSLLQLQADSCKHFETNSVLYVELFTSTITKYACRYKSSEICSGRFRMFISKPFSRTAFAYVYSKNTPATTADALKKYANQFFEQSLFGNTFKTATDEYLPPIPRCENEIYNGVEAGEATNRVRTKLVPWFEMICALIAAMAVFLLEILFTVITFVFSVRRYFWM